MEKVYQIQVNVGFVAQFIFIKRHYKHFCNISLFLDKQKYFQHRIVINEVKGRIMYIY